jgi:hypothetical protein
VADRVDFSANATVYDRRHGAALSDDSVTRLWLAAGLRSGAAVLDIGVGTGHGRLESLGFVRETELALGPGPSVTLREFLRRLVEGELSYIWGVPDSVRSECLPDLTRWSEQTFDLDRPMPMPQEIRWSVYRKGAA